MAVQSATLTRKFSQAIYLFSTSALSRVHQLMATSRGGVTCPWPGGMVWVGYNTELASYIIAS